MKMKITVIKTPCYPCEWTLSKDGRTPLDNGDFHLWFRTREEAEVKAREMALTRLESSVCNER